jgi:hypothetical protein
MMPLEDGSYTVQMSDIDGKVDLMVTVFIWRTQQFTSYPLLPLLAIR